MSEEDRIPTITDGEILDLLVHWVTQEDVEAIAPILIGAERWEAAGNVVSYKGDEWAKAEIRKSLDHIARIEAIRRAQTMHTDLIMDRADEICREVYGVPLEDAGNIGHVHMKALFLMAQRELEKESNTDD